MDAIEGTANGANGANGHAPALLAEIYRPEPRPEIAKLLEELQVPFDAVLVRWRANANETKIVQGRMQGLCRPYADPRAYKDRLNALLSPVAWRDRYSITTIPTKVLVTCELSIDSLGCHSATGEEWSRNENAGTSAEAQAFKRACACFGLGRYLYYFEGVCLDLDRDKRPKANPTLPEWATPDGWRQGLRPVPVVTKAHNTPAQEPDTTVPEAVVRSTGSHKNVVREILSMEREIGTGLYRGLLKSVARAWNPGDIREISLQQRVLQHMEGALRGLKRLRAARAKLSDQVVTSIFQSLDLGSVIEIRDLDTLHTLVLALERAAGITG